MAVSSNGIEFSAGEQVEASSVLLHEEVQHHAGPVLHRGVPLSVADSLRVQVQDLDVLLGVSEPMASAVTAAVATVRIEPCRPARIVQRCKDSAGEGVYVAESGHLEAGGVAGAVDVGKRVSICWKAARWWVSSAP